VDDVLVVVRHARIARPDTGAVEVRDLTLTGGGASSAVYELDLPQHTVLPALFNAHDHLQLNCVPPLRQAQHFANSYAWSEAYRSHFEDAELRLARQIPLGVRHWQGALKNALCGATTVMHHDPLPSEVEHPGFPVNVVRPYGWAHSLHLEYGPPVAPSFQATAPDVGWFIHLAEGVDEPAAAELQELKRLGCLRGNTVLIHGVGLSDADVASVIAAGAGLVWCPSSNLSILGQTVSRARLRTLFDAGDLTLGTDSRLSGAPDLLQELRVAANHSDFSARELLQLVTSSARRLLRAREACNDVVVFRSSSQDPFADLLQLRRGELRAVVRNGEPLIADLDFEGWFLRHEIAFTQVRLDGYPKLCASTLLSLPNGQPPLDLEPGLVC
jgi:cytosine/adenosine deaminase-related metal-dependent hydrolase